MENIFLHKPTYELVRGLSPYDVERPIFSTSNGCCPAGKFSLPPFQKQTKAIPIPGRALGLPHIGICGRHLPFLVDCQVSPLRDTVEHPVDFVDCETIRSSPAWLIVSSSNFNTLPSDQPERRRRRRIVLHSFFMPPISTINFFATCHRRRS